MAKNDPKKTKNGQKWQKWGVFGNWPKVTKMGGPKRVQKGPKTEKRGYWGSLMRFRPPVDDFGGGRGNHRVRKMRIGVGGGFFLPKAAQKPGFWLLRGQKVPKTGQKWGWGGFLVYYGVYIYIYIYIYILYIPYIYPIYIYIYPIYYTKSHPPQGPVFGHRAISPKIIYI